MTNQNGRYRPAKATDKRRGHSIRVRELIVFAFLSLWFYWIIWCQPLNNYEIETTPKNAAATVTVSTSSSTLAEKSPPSQLVVTESVKTTEPEQSGTESPTVEESDGIGEDEAEQDDQDSGSGEDDDDVSGAESDGEQENKLENMSDHDMGMDEESEEEDQENGSDEDEDEDEDEEDDTIDPDSYGKRPIQSVVSTEERFENHKYMFIHIGKAAGTSIRNNIFSLCIRRNIEQNIYHHRRGKELNKVQAVPCIKAIKAQSERNPTTEMVISNDMVLGYMHMHSLNYWWNANDDGEAIEERARKQDIQDEISGILASGIDNAWNITVIKNPPTYTKKDDGMTKSTAFFVPIRDPIDRLVSAFNMEHPKNKHQKYKCNAELKKFQNWVTDSFYCKCFNTINDLADAFKENAGPSKYVSFYKDSTKKLSCLEIAERVVRGKSHYKFDNGKTNESHLREDQRIDLELIRKKIGFMIGHVTMNYGYYYRRSFLKYPEKDIVVIRTEHQWEDLQDLEYKLGGSARIEGEATGHQLVSHGSHKYEANEKIKDPNDFQTICCAISSEAKIYIELLERAINLSEEQKKESLMAFKKRCDLELCPR